MRNESFSPSDKAEIEEHLKKKLNQFAIGAVVITVLSFIIGSIKSSSMDGSIFLIVLSFFIGIIGTVVYFVYVGPIKRDLKQGEKVIFQTKITDKISSSAAFIDEYILSVESNQMGIKRVHVDEKTYNELQVFDRVELTIGKHSKFVLDCMYLPLD